MTAPNTTPRAGGENSDALLILLQLESAARRVLEADALPFLMVNETRRLLTYRQAVLFAADQAGSLRVTSISSVATVDRNTPMLQWLERLLAALRPTPNDIQPQRFSVTDAPADLAGDWAEFSLPYTVWAPLRTPAGAMLGGLWLSRETVWNDNELALLERLTEAYAHAWQALPKPVGTSVFKLPLVRRVGLIALLSLLIPVRMSALAPVEIVPKQPIVVSAPLDGVISSIEIMPNQMVNEAQVLIRFEDTVLRSNHLVAEKSLAVAEAEHLRAMQGAFGDEKTKADVALLKAKVDLARAERDYAHDSLARVEVKASQAGVAIFRDTSDWIGKPVRTGERIMVLADPRQMALRINLPVKDAISLQTGAEVRAFFDADPLHPLAGEVRQASYQAEVISGDLLAYRLDAEFSETEMPENVRIGWQGTAKVYGARTPLLYYLLRRPIAVLRQTLGF